MNHIDNKGMGLMHASVHYKDRAKLPVSVELHFEGNTEKLVYELRIFSSNRARIEKRRLYDFNEEKSKYESMSSAEYRDIEGIKSVRDAAKEFLQQAKSIPIDNSLSRYDTDTYYAKRRRTNTKSDYSTNPVRDNLKLLVQAYDDGKWCTVAAFKSEDAAKDYARALGNKYPNMKIRVFLKDK